MQILHIGYDSAVLTAVVVFLLALATIFQYLMGVSGVPLLVGELLRPLESAHWLFLVGGALITMVFGMVLEGVPAAGVLIPGVVPNVDPPGSHTSRFGDRATRGGCTA